MSTSNVKVGDFVAVFSGYGLGRRIGSDSSWATPWTDEIARECGRDEAARRLHRKQRILSREFSWHALTDEQCDSVLALLASFGLDRGAKT